MSGAESGNSLCIMIQDNLLTEAQMGMLHKLAQEFVSLNETADRVKRGTDRLLESSRRMVQILESQS